MAIETRELMLMKNMLSEIPLTAYYKKLKDPCILLILGLGTYIHT